MILIKTNTLQVGFTYPPPEANTSLVVEYYMKRKGQFYFRGKDDIKIKIRRMRYVGDYEDEHKLEIDVMDSTLRYGDTCKVCIGVHRADITIQILR